MRTWVVAAVVAVVLVFASLPALAVVLASNDSGGSVGERVAQHPGPSPWSSRGPGMAPGDRQHWRQLTPAQRRTTMAKLARQRAKALERWASCLEAGRTDCIRPMPPGLLRHEARQPPGRR